MSEPRQPAAKLIYERLETMIAEGHFKDGERLDETMLAQEFGVSRTPLREALRQLTANGLTETFPNRGTFVRRPDFVRIVEMFEVMAEMEAWCARLAATRATAAQLLLLRHAASRCEAALQENDSRAYYAHNETFHRLIYEASGNGFLAEETSAMQGRLKAFRQAQLFVPDRLARSMQEHRMILKALEAQDAPAVERLVRDHVRIQSTTYQEFRAPDDLAEGAAWFDKAASRKASTV
ncbi:GntR family transcriptional regulator [Rhizobium sp. SL86]|uniref:GntR family transcriptional regulator n=1 Tax=Rhizobium sp. SL86 TaxID=2995148 RepID=UPI002272EBC9|nr:GntR family transcriptional regulator [Rhizobium sp. SL86]MCY1665882.1 GntR family transcriptional regulator [Rhizobium sp. SL86]